MLAAIEAANGRNPEQLSADAGYCSEDTLDKLAERAIDGYVAIKPAAMGSGRRVSIRQAVRIGRHRPCPSYPAVAPDDKPESTATRMSATSCAGCTAIAGSLTKCWRFGRVTSARCTRSCGT